MSKYPRASILFDESLFHITWKCHNDAFLLKSEFAKQTYYDLLLKYKDKYGLKFFSYCFMDNHPHLTGQCRTQKEASDFFRVVNGCFARILNKSLGRKGQVVMDRFKSPQIQSESILQKVIIYNDLNPLRTKKQIHPGEFKWTSYHHYAYGIHDPLLTDPEFYLAMSTDPIERQKHYRQMIEDVVVDELKKFLENGRKKPIFTKQKFKLFIGDPHWVKEKHQNLREQFKSKNNLAQTRLASQTTQMLH